MHLYMLCASMKDKVFRDLVVAHVVAMNWNWFNGLNPYVPHSLFSHIASQVATTAPLYSAFVLDNATIDCFLLLQEIVAILKENINPNVNR